MTKIESEIPSGADEIRTVYAALTDKEPGTVTRAKRPVKKVEPAFQALRRILGDSVLEIFPIQLRQAVDQSYMVWQQNPDTYLVTEFDTVEEMDDALFLMRAYAQIAGEKGYSIRTVDPDAAPELHWRAQTRFKRGTVEE